MDRVLSRYQTALDYLFARVSGGWKLGLETTRTLLAALGEPQSRYPTLHVAGTNGKGSVCSTLDALLRASGRRVGRYTSPHLIDFRERICVDGVPISEEAVVGFLERWAPEVEKVGATFFEATTCMAFDHFARAQVDVAVIEVGLGGRLDSTNVITPVVTGITSIGLDHMQYLGDTESQIAAEKAGIFKAGVPAVIGEQGVEIRTLLAEIASQVGAEPVVIVAESWQVSDIDVQDDGTRFLLRTPQWSRRLHTPLVGRFQATNAATALAMLESAGPPWAEAVTDVDRALAQVAIPGRFQRCGDIIFDVAHNPASVAMLCDTLTSVRPQHPLSCLLTVLRDKDWRAMMRMLAAHVDRFVLTAPPSVPADRAWRLDHALAFARENGWDATADVDFDHAVEHARAGAATTLITGSFHTVGDAMACLQVSPLGA
ncbi:MAG TPA: folylpolyglutamate synthase/dihydrofolate synthase family protein [Gemmatimonadaceae bacterium]|nr:folylpolyglutamate synthase/dihydrofolate synthase family protein [Gemmatimonadaceae bacterium]